MPALSSPWFQQSGSEVVTQPPPRSSTQSSMSGAELEDLTKRVSRPTTSSAAKRTMSWKLEDTYMEKGRHSWAKMELFEDCKKCMWTNNGTVKPSCKIRPVKQGLRASIQ